MARVAQNGGRRPFLDDAARIHHQDAARERGDRREIVADPDQRRPEIAHEAAHLGEDLRLDRHVQRRRRLIANDQRRPVQQRDRDRDALAHAARELMRIGVEALRGVGDADGRERLDRARPRGFLRHALVRLDRQAHLRCDGQHRIEHAHRILEHHGHAPPAQAPQRFALQPDKLLPCELDRAADDPARRIDQAENGKPGDALAGTRLADEADDFAGRHVERHAFDRLDDAGAGHEMRRQIAHLEQRAHRLSLGLN